MQHTPAFDDSNLTVDFWNGRDFTATHRGLSLDDAFALCADLMAREGNCPDNALARIWDASQFRIRNKFSSAKHTVVEPTMFTLFRKMKLGGNFYTNTSTRELSGWKGAA